jgi:nickel transport system substrate-binding protein
MTFRVFLAGSYYPLLQELTFVRPLRFLSPQAFIRNASSPTAATANSCPANRGTIRANNATATCVGINAPMGTGPMRFAAKVTNMREIGPANVSFTPLLAGERVSYIRFERNTQYWGDIPVTSTVITPANLNSSAVKAALLSGEVDVAYGFSVLSPADFVDLRDNYGKEVSALLSDPIQTRALLLNSARDATSSLAVRRAINAALDKQVLRRALSLLELPADRLFATDMPYSNVPIGVTPIYSLTEARNLLGGAGWAFPSPNSPIREKNGVPLQLELRFIATDSVHVQVAEFVASQLLAVGIGVTLVGLEKQLFNERMFAGNFSIGITVSTCRPLHPSDSAVRSCWASIGLPLPVPNLSLLAGNGRVAIRSPFVRSRLAHAALVRVSRVRGHGRRQRNDTGRALGQYLLRVGVRCGERTGYPVAEHPHGS